MVVGFGYTETPPAELGGDVLIDHFAALPAAVGRLLHGRLRAPAGSAIRATS